MTVFADPSQIKDGETFNPPRIVVYGVQGIGKSELACIGTPNPVAIQIERGGLDEITTIKKWPTAKTFETVIDQIDSLTDDKHNYKTLVIDSLDWLEKLIWKRVCEDHGKKTMEDFGWQSGYKEALNLWDDFLEKLDDLRDKRKMIIFCTAHSKITKFKNPEAEPYDMYDLNLHAGNDSNACNLVSQWADAVLFLNYKTYTTKLQVGRDKNNTVIRPTDTQERIIYTQKRATFNAKNRYKFPPEIIYLKDKGWLELSKYFRKPQKNENKPETKIDSENKINTEKKVLSTIEDIKNEVNEIKNIEKQNGTNS